MKAAERDGKVPLCSSCQVKEFVICRENAHVLCHNREHEWAPVPFVSKDCGLYTKKEEIPATAA
jgi:hypothetical protein